MGFHNHKELNGKQNVVLKAVNMLNLNKELAEAHNTLHIKSCGKKNWRHINRHYNVNYPKIANPLKGGKNS